MISDDELVKLIETDSNKGFEVLIQIYQQRIYRLIRRMVGSHEETDDLIQEVFIRVYRSIHKFKKNSSLYTWIYRIATNETINYLKKSKRIKYVDSNIALTIKDTVHMETKTVLNQLYLAIDKLPPKQMEIFKMRYFDEMKYEEISEILGTSVGALKASYHHAVKKIETTVKESNIY
jgi:RNA polymerase sigma-70 factor (ECF subfamily)